MGVAARQLEEFVEAELFRPAPESALTLAERIRETHGETLAAVVFYGSCLRRSTDEGVLDFYALVDSYGDAYPSRLVARANGWLPPNVFYLQIERQPEPLRAKYAVYSTADFEHAAGPDTLRVGIWARFCQPALVVYARDDASRAVVARSAARAVTTALECVVPLLPGDGDVRRFTPAELWQTAFRATYGYEMRPESPEAAAAIYDADPERFDRATRLGLEALAERGELELKVENGHFTVQLPEGRADRARRAWERRRPLAKLAYLLQLGKTTTTMGDWLPYALWKLERHTGTRLVPTDLQRRHPLIFGWPLLFRALWRRDLR